MNASYRSFVASASLTGFFITWRERSLITRPENIRLTRSWGDNATFLADARASLQKDLDPLGISLKQLGFIGAPRPPQGVIDSINLQVQASQIALQKQMEVAQAEADARKHVAEAEAEANRKVAASLTSTLIEWRKMDKWDGHLSMVSGAGSGVLLNMPGK